MSIAENIAFGLRIKNKSKVYIDDKIKYALKLVNLNGYEKRSINSLQAFCVEIAVIKKEINAVASKIFDAGIDQASRALGDGRLHTVAKCADYSQAAHITAAKQPADGF